MNAQCNPHLVSLCRSLSRASSTTVILLGFLVLTGWILDIDVLKRIYPAFVSMKVNTALAFLAAGLSLLLLRMKRIDKAASPHWASLRRFERNSWDY